MAKGFATIFLLPLVNCMQKAGSPGLGLDSFISVTLTTILPFRIIPLLCMFKISSSPLVSHYPLIRCEILSSSAPIRTSYLFVNTTSYVLETHPVLIFRIYLHSYFSIKTHFSCKEQGWQHRLESNTSVFITFYICVKTSMF